MRKYVVYLVKVLIFLMVLFAGMRIVFIVNYWNLVNHDMVPFIEVLRGFVKAWPLDIATACFIMPFPALVMFILTCFDRDISYRWVRWYFYLVISLYILAVMGEETGLASFLLELYERTDYNANDRIMTGG